MIPIYGSMSRPENPQEGLAALIEGRIPWDGDKLTVAVSTDEFTSICPTTGQPDFSTIQISYKPRNFYLESKTIKFYFWSFREFGCHCEKLAVKMRDDVLEAIDPLECHVIVTQMPRGGIKIVAEAAYP